ncbi:MAG: preprotein translocase subunit SecE [bacterium]
MSSAARAATGIKTFLDEVISELRKSSWPTRAELIETTAVIIVSVIALGIFVATSDLILEKAISLLVGGSG